MRILVVEDEPALRSALEDLVRGEGHDVESVADADSATEAGCSDRFDLILLDVMLPGGSGIDVCRSIRAARPDLFIVMLTARGSEDNKVKGLGAGADDYVTKPFGARELLARIASAERRLTSAAGDAEELEIDGCRLDLGRCVARRDDDERPLTAREAAILRLLHRHRKRGVTRSELLEQVWRAPGDLPTRTVDMTIANLRSKIEQDPSSPRIVVTVKGIGYAWGEP